MRHAQCSRCLLSMSAGNYRKDFVMQKSNKIMLATIASAALVTGGGVIGAATSGASVVDGHHSATSAAAGKARANNLSPSVVGNSTSIAPNANGSASVTCPAGTLLTGGGWNTSGFSIFATDSFGSGNTWTVIAHNTGNSGNTESVTAFARCLRAL
jgi:hypothetical protein